MRWFGSWAFYIAGDLWWRAFKWSFTVCTLEIVNNMKDARAWFRKTMIDRPWEPRN